jgi:hypothetical protein
MKESIAVGFSQRLESALIFGTLVPALNILFGLKPLKVCSLIAVG